MRSRAPLTQRGARPSSEPLPPPAPPQRAMRRVADIGTVTVAGQQLRVGRTYAGQTVAITMEDTVFRVLHNDVELMTHARRHDHPIQGLSPTPQTPHPISRPRRRPACPGRPASPEAEPSRIS
jgi:hypothetical protein